MFLKSSDLGFESKIGRGERRKAWRAELSWGSSAPAPLQVLGRSTPSASAEELKVQRSSWQRPSQSSGAEDGKWGPMEGAGHWDLWYFFLSLLCCLHSPMAPFSTCCPVPIRHSPALRCSQQAPAKVWIPKSCGDDPELSLVSTSRSRGVQGLRAPPAVPRGSLDGSGAAAAQPTRSSPRAKRCHPQNPAGVGITKGCDNSAASPTAGAEHLGTEGLCQLRSMGPLGFCPPRHRNPPCLQLVASLITQMRPLCLARPRCSRRCCGAARDTPFPLGSIFLFIGVKFPSFSMPRT